MATVLRPQRMFEQAVRDAERLRQPAGLGLDSQGVRERMIARLGQVPDVHSAVLGAMQRVPRHQFVDPALAPQAYEDTALPIGFGQTISKPSVVARMLSLLMQGSFAAQQGHLGRVLEIGTGCGYQAAVLCGLGKSVIGMERISGLHEKSRLLLRRWLSEAGLDLPVRWQHGDGRLGAPQGAPFESIVAAAGGEALPPAWLEQLAPGGRLVAPMASGEAGLQSLLVVDRLAAGGYQHTRYEAVAFVPLKSGLI